MSNSMNSKFIPKQCLVAYRKGARFKKCWKSVWILGMEWIARQAHKSQKDTWWDYLILLMILLVYQFCVVSDFPDLGLNQCVLPDA